MFIVSVPQSHDYCLSPELIIIFSTTNIRESLYIWRVEAKHTHYEADAAYED